jgi:hypothetical protein
MSLNKFTSSIQPDTWNNITVTVNKTGDVKFSMNNKVETSASTADLSSMNLGNNLLVGAENNTIFTNTLTGGVDDVRVYDKAITDNQIEDEIQTFDLLKIKDGADISAFNQSISTTTGASISGETITFNGSSTVEIDGTTLNEYDLSQFTFKTFVNPTTNGGVLMRKDLENNGFIEVRLNADNKLELEISDKPVYDVTAALNDSTVTVSGKTTTNAGATPTIYSVAYTTPQQDKDAIYNDISYFTDETPLSESNITGLDSSKYSTIQPTGGSEFNVELPILGDGTTMTATVNHEIDYDATKTPWILVLNYLHEGGTNPSTVVKDTTSGLPYLPADNSLQLFKDGAFDASLLGRNGNTHETSAYSWGHTGNDLFDKLCIALGSDGGNNNGLELKWTAICESESDNIHFISYNEISQAFEYFRTGTGNASSLGIDGNYIHLSGGASLLLPGTTNTGAGSNKGNLAFTEGPLNSYISGGSAVTGLDSWFLNNSGRFEVNKKHSGHTYHQIWVRATINDGMSQEMKTALTPPVTTPIYKTPKDIVSVQAGVIPFSLDSLTYTNRGSFESFTPGGDAIGNNGIELYGTNYTTWGLGRVQQDTNGINYLEMSTGQLNVPFATANSEVNHTFYFVVRAADDRSDADGRIHRLIKSISIADSLDISINYGGHYTGIYPFNFTTTGWHFNQDFDPKDSFCIVVMKVTYPTNSTANARIMFTAKPNETFITAEANQDSVPSYAAATYGYDFSIGHSSASSTETNFKLYEFGVIDEFVDDETFDKIVDVLKQKYYNTQPALTIQPSSSGSTTEYNVEIPVDGTTMTATVNAEIDADETKTPWILVCNYINQGVSYTSSSPPTDESTRMLTEKLPFLPDDASFAYDQLDVTDLTSNFPDGYREHTDTWGHTNPSLFTKICDGLGDAGLQVRFRAKTSLHNRQIHFKTTDDDTNQITTSVLNEFKTGLQANVGTNSTTFSQGSPPLVDLYNDHTPGAMPDTSTSPVYWAFMGSSANGNTMINGIFTNGQNNNRYWRINSGNNMFCVDDHPNNVYGYNTYHQIWVRADLATCPEAMKNALFPVTVAAPIHNLTKVLERTSPDTNPEDLNSYGITGVTNNVYVYTLGLTGDINSLVSGSNTEPYAISENRVQVVAGEDFTILEAINVVSESNKLTTDISVSLSGGYENYWAFALKNSDAIDLSDANTDLKVQLETFIEQYISMGVAGKFYDSNAVVTGTKHREYGVSVNGTYQFSGDATGSQPDFTVYTGDILTFNVTVSGHPFYIKTAQVTGTDNQASGVVNNGSTSGVVRWYPTTVRTYYYQCQYHGNMYGTITVAQRPPAYTQGVVFEYAFDSLTSVTPTALDTEANTYLPVVVALGSDGKYYVSLSYIDENPNDIRYILQDRATFNIDMSDTTSYTTNNNILSSITDTTNSIPGTQVNTSTEITVDATGFNNKPTILFDPLFHSAIEFPLNRNTENKYTVAIVISINTPRSTNPGSISTPLSYANPDSPEAFTYRTWYGHDANEIKFATDDKFTTADQGCVYESGSNVILIGTRDTTTLINRLYKADGTSTTATIIGNNDNDNILNKLFIGGQNAYVGDTRYNFGGKISEVIILHEVLSDEQIDYMKSYLLSKWFNDDLKPLSSVITQSLSWTPVVTETPVTRIIVEDVVSQSNVMTIGSGIVASTSPITNYWAFAVKNSDAVDFSDTNTELTTQIETFIEQYLDFGITNNLFTSYTNSYEHGSGLKVFSLSGATFEYAFDSLTSVTPTALDTEANTYTPVVVALGSDGKYVTNFEVINEVLPDDRFFIIQHDGCQTTQGYDYYNPPHFWDFNILESNYIALESGTNITAVHSSPDYFKPYLVFSGERGSTNASWDGKSNFIMDFHESVREEFFNKGFMLFRSPLSDPITSIMFRTGAHMSANGAIKKYRVFEYIGNDIEGLKEYFESFSSTTSVINPVGGDPQPTYYGGAESWYQVGDQVVLPDTTGLSVLDVTFPDIDQRLIYNTSTGNKSLSWTPVVTTSGVTHSLINTTLEIVNDAINIPYNIVTTTTVVKHYVALFEANAVTDKTDVELLTTVQSVANVDGTSGAIVSEEQLAAGPHDKTINMTFAINASGGATAVNIGTGYVVKVFTMNEGWESGGLGTTTNVPYDQTKSLETQLSEMGMNYASDVDHHFDASGTTASTTVITDGVSGTITTTNVTFGNDGEFGYFKQAALGKIQSVPLLYLPDEWTHVIVVKPNSGGYDGLNWYDGGNTYQIHIGNSGLKRIKINHYSGQVGYQDTSIVSDGTFVNFVCICVFTHNRTTNSGKHWIKWNNGSTDIFDTNTASSLNITATNFYYGRSDNSTFDGDFYELAVIKKYFSDDTELDQIGNYFYYKYYGGGPDSQSTTTNPSINVLTKEIPLGNLEFATNVTKTALEWRATSYSGDGGAMTGGGYSWSEVNSSTEFTYSGSYHFVLTASGDKIHGIGGAGAKHITVLPILGVVGDTDVQWAEHQDHNYTNRIYNNGTNDNGYLEFVYEFTENKTVNMIMVKNGRYGSDNIPPDEYEVTKFIVIEYWDGSQYQLVDYSNPNYINPDNTNEVIFPTAEGEIYPPAWKEFEIYFSEVNSSKFKLKFCHQRPTSSPYNSSQNTRAPYAMRIFNVTV